MDQTKVNKFFASCDAYIDKLTRSKMGYLLREHDADVRFIIYSIHFNLVNGT